MKRKWEDEQEKNYREAGLTKETIERISKWIENSAKEETDDKSE
jgi:hypothetical protein